MAQAGSASSRPALSGAWLPLAVFRWECACQLWLVTALCSEREGTQAAGGQVGRAKLLLP